jgi:LDH2 family malate/lactate/ureidoglycolate dehydrogenase
MSMRRFDPARLGPGMQAALQRRGVGADSAGHVAASLIETSLRGVDSHGINLFPYYVSAVEGGRINPAPAFTVVNRRAALATLDADAGFGHHAGIEAMTLAMELADGAGVGAVGVRRSTHFGAAAYFAQHAARRGYAAFAFTNADALVRAFGGAEPFCGTNPICFSVPLRGEEPFCLDMATSRVSWNKVMIKRQRGEPMPAGWAGDADGEPTTDAMAARMLEPVGEYKGYGLGLMVAILCAGFMDAPFDRDILPMYGSPLSERRSISHFFLAIRIGDFVDPDRFAQRMAGLAARVRSMAPRDADAVMVPGDPEKQQFAIRSVAGIPVDDDKAAQFMEISPDFAAALRP